MATNYQHESPVVPEKWSEEERRYARAVDELLERLFAALGSNRQRLADLERAVKELKDAADE